MIRSRPKIKAGGRRFNRVISILLETIDIPRRNHLDIVRINRVGGGCRTDTGFGGYQRGTQLHTFRRSSKSRVNLREVDCRPHRAHHFDEWLEHIRQRWGSMISREVGDRVACVTHIVQVLYSTRSFSAGGRDRDERTGSWFTRVLNDQKKSRCISLNKIETNNKGRK